jgi:hypothetical protein
MNRYVVHPCFCCFGDSIPDFDVDGRIMRIDENWGWVVD